MASHPDDEFHPPTSDDPAWAETCWFSFCVPERGLAGQLYPFFTPNLGVCAAAAYLWDESGFLPWDALYVKNFWHLPIPEAPLSDITLANGIRYRCVEPLTRYEVGYDDPDTDELTIRLEFTAVAPPHYLGEHHIDQPGRYRGTIDLRGERIEVDAFGFRDRSWGPRTQFGPGVGHVGYSYGSASAGDGFHSIVYGGQLVHGHVRRGGEWAALTAGSREVLDRDPVTGYPRQVRIEATDADGRGFVADGRCRAGLALQINPNLLSIDSLTEWSFDGQVGHGLDNDDWGVPAARSYFRERRR